MKILYITPHLSTGGCPQFLLKKIQVLHKDHEIYCIEYADHGCFTVQKNKIKEILKDRLIEVNYDRSKIIDIIKDLDPDVVHLEEMPEYFMDPAIANKIYIKDRRYKIIETSHDSSFDPKTKLFFPDKLIYVSKYQKENLTELDVPSEVCEYPILINPRKPREEALRVLGLDPKKKHVVHVGLFTPRKNQKEIIEYAKMLKDHPIQFHFIGNQADNFRGYWEPLMKDFPNNCKWWNERKDVDNFYQAADLFLFVSKDENGDKETSPLVIREAISYNIPTLIYNSPVYMGMYDKYDNIEYLDYGSKEDNAKKIFNTLEKNTKNIMTMEPQKQEEFTIEYDSSDNKINLWSRYTLDSALVTIRELDSMQVMYSCVFSPIHKDVTYFIIPVPKVYCDLETDKYCGGMCVEIRKNDEIIYEKKFRIKHLSLTKPMVELKNNTSPAYNNYIEFFVAGIYDNYLVGKKFDTVVDVGANVGLFCEYMRRKSQCKKIYAFEPNLQALKIIKESFTNNEFIVIEKALMDKDGELEFFVDDGNSTIGSANKNHQSSLNNSYKVQGMSFRTFLKEYGIDYIDLFKMDIESGEYSFFASMEKEDLDKIGMMMIEYHLQGGQSVDKEVAILLALFRGAGFKCDIKDQHAGGGFIIATK